MEFFVVTSAALVALVFIPGAPEAVLALAYIAHVGLGVYDIIDIGQACTVVQK